MGNKRVAGGNSGHPRLSHSFYLIVTGIPFPRIPKSKVDHRAELHRLSYGLRGSPFADSDEDEAVRVAEAQAVT